MHAPPLAAAVASAALLLLASSRGVRALDADCQRPGAPPYTGYALKGGSGCRQYVYCQNGFATSTRSCASGLLYNGSVGAGGICTWPSGVICAAGGAASGGGGAAAAATAPRPTPALSASRPSAVSANGDGGDNPHQFFCGKTAADAPRHCVPCATGSIVECWETLGMYHGCFKGVAACAGIADVLDDNRGDIVAQFHAHFDREQDSRPAPPVASPHQSPNRPAPPTAGRNPPASAPTYPTPSLSQSRPRPAPRPTREPSLPPWTNAPFRPSPTAGPKTVIAYYASWQWYDRNKFADPANVDFSKYDRINYAFFQPCPLGRLYGTDEWADPQLLWGPYDYRTSDPARRFCSWDGPGPAARNCNYHDTSRGLLTLARRAGTEVWPSIGGWTLSDNFPGIAASAVKRETFARECVQLIEAYGFDGIDIDWEYPGYEDHSGTPADTVNFTLLLRAVRAALDRLGSLRGRFYGLTAALPCGPDKIDKIQVHKIKDILTELNLMSYDLHGSWDALTGTNAPLFDQGWSDKTRRWSVHGCVDNYVDRGVPLAKMNIGLPFYGRSFRGATGMKQTHRGADDINFHLDEGSPQYFNIVNELRGMTTYRHEKTRTQYAVFNDGGGVVSYDDPRAICDKVEYANERGLHGFLIWEISGDMIDTGTGVMATPLIDATNAKIRNPRFPCSNLRDPQWALADRNYRYAPDEPAVADWSNYAGPALGTGSANDFNGAGVALPAPGPAAAVPATPANAVYRPPAVAAGGGVPADGGDGACPAGHTGYVPVAACTSYLNCLGGRPVGVAQPCSPGTLFSADVGGCTWAATVQCGAP